MLKDLILAGVIATSVMTSSTAYSGTNTEIKKSTGGDLSYITVADASMYDGKITDVKKTKDGLDVMVSKLGESDSPLNSLIFHVNNDTKLNVAKETLKIGDRVNVFFSGAVTRSIPGQATAIAINQLKEDCVYEGQIEEVIDNKYGKSISVVSDSKNSNFDKIIFNISDKTSFNNGSLLDLKKGAKVKVVYGPVMTMSLPPHTTALNIEFVK
ncbi:hypothetical protein [Clostridium aciditolerans]|uniref:Uncharacterized protein n=1 Tax=Clostridium aciditolerans TaxID=339861 RepID=A0A934M2K5_9CLOT|nr:hypothetical protein [Clostridium aciditolerans]MBI6872040.1 hypothetical protein [Clostridium aciditolerans]